MEAMDSTKLPPEPGTSQGGECIELNESDEGEADVDGENNFTG